MPILGERESWYKSSISRSQIKSITFVDGPEFITEQVILDSWDASKFQNEKVMAYVLDDYSLHIVGNGEGVIYGNPDSSYAFSANFNQDSTLTPFNYVETINNANIFDPNKKVSNGMEELGND